ncbi:acetyl-CoA synthetase [Geopseudomonas sagittaria]|uniref:acetate--CoA ligase n=1 Tax=Geopseudomonas sagittaria TaxID=1135990 RepID=A0A1I5Y5Y1_9GAMM|nr:AMP-binding protein [Pseudomonas sagittaria]SFQ39608.1 acetyl-CoA synthetase [Pseudomonas sagittaria]
MRPKLIDKTPAELRVEPNWPATAAARAAFSWAEEAKGLSGLPGGGLNLAYEAVDRHAAGPLREHCALRLLFRDGCRREVSYGELARQTSRFANVLGGLGVPPGARLFVLCNRGLELYLGVLGGLKAGCVVSPLFSAFGPEPLQTRLRLGEGSVLLTSESLYRRKVAPIRDQLPLLKHVLLFDDNGGTVQIAATHDLRQLMDRAADDFTVAPTSADSPSLLHFTSGTTGTPKGALHVHGAALTHLVTGKYALDLHPDDVFWCTADPGWVTGTSYGILAPLLLGVTSVVDCADFDAVRWYGILRSEKVSVWYTAPTAIRLLMKAGDELARAHKYPDLRFVASVGEPLNPEAVWWGQEERYRRCFAGDWYLSGDLARRDADGYYWFVGRSDDVIKSAGHLIGPFEVESALLEHPAVAEAAVIGKPDEILGETVKAFVSLKGDFTASAELHDGLLAHARRRLGAAVAPKELEILDSLPRTRSGKLMRRLLKARELGLPEGDTSTLENP